ncbi:glycosyltransferase [Nocardia callitridis]|uniref:Glycosyltransferase n=1 Tax=Nocardia callitridis TaxID=648753 RepID=A0ABP9KKS6_9NOCA
MKFVLAFTGSRGDVQPALALGVALGTRGHDVQLAAPPNLVEFGRRAGLSTHPYGTDTKELLDSDLVTDRLKSANPLTKLRAISELTLRGGRQMQAELMELTADADAIIGGSVGQERALNVAQAREIGYIPVHYCPVRRNGVVSMLPGDRLPNTVRRASWTGLEHVLWQATRTAEQTLAADLGLDRPTTPAATRIARRGAIEIQAYDPALFPGLAGEWGAQRPLVGFFDLDRTTRGRVDGTDTETAAWLDAGPPPIYLGFGSMTVAEPARLAKVFAEVTAALGYRLLVAAGWSEFMAGQDSDRVRVVRTLDHATVLPRCAAAIHHGGAGSTAAGLRAGIPTLVCWLGADQPMWGARLRALGVGTALRQADLDRRSLQSALTDILRPECQRTAWRLSADLIAPDVAVRSAAVLAEDAASTHRPLRRPAAARSPMNAKTLSVVIPAYNEEQVIGDCLARLTAQLDHIAEIIVVDNNSTDRTADAVRGFGQHHPSITLIDEARQGLVYARNTGMNAATSDLIARIDADTLVGPDWARTIVDFFERDTEEYWAAACGRGEAYGLPYGDRLGKLKQRMRERKRAEVRAVPVLYGSNMIVRTQVWAAIRDRVGMRRDIFEDVDCGLCVTETGGRNAFLPEITVGVAARRMETGMPGFVRYMSCLPRTLLLHRRYALAAAAALLYVPSVSTLHAARLALLRSYDTETGTFAARNILRPTTDRVAP